MPSWPAFDAFECFNLTVPMQNYSNQHAYSGGMNYGPCSKCGRIAVKMCDKCKQPVCKEHFNHIQNICKSCAGGISVK